MRTFLGEGGGGGLSAQIVSAPVRKPKAPSAPSLKNPSYASGVGGGEIMSSFGLASRKVGEYH